MAPSYGWIQETCSAAGVRRDLGEQQAEPWKEVIICVCLGSLFVCLFACLFVFGCEFFWLFCNVLLGLFDFLRYFKIYYIESCDS